MFKVIVCGGRDYENWQHVHSELNALHKQLKITHVIHGDAPGADKAGGRWAREHGVQEIVCPSNWDKHGTRGGPLRNQAMLQLVPDLVLAFPGGRGTADMTRQANEGFFTIKVCEPVLKAPVLVMPRKTTV